MADVIAKSTVREQVEWRRDAAMATGANIDLFDRGAVQFIGRHRFGLTDVAIQVPVATILQVAASYLAHMATITPMREVEDAARANRD